MPALLYGLEACHLNKADLNSLDFVVNRFFMKYTLHKQLYILLHVPSVNSFNHHLDKINRWASLWTDGLSSPMAARDVSYSTSKLVAIPHPVSYPVSYTVRECQQMFRFELPSEQLKKGEESLLVIKL